MERPRIRIATMLGVVLFCAVGFAAMRRASDGWASFCFSLALGVLGLATLPLLLRRGPGRAYWLGFNVLGWGYFVACFTPWFEWSIRPHLLTTRAIERAAAYVVRQDAAASGQPGQSVVASLDYFDATTVKLFGQPQGSVIYSGWPYPIVTTPLGPGDPANVQRIGHSLLALVIAAVGGSLARRVSVVRAT